MHEMNMYNSIIAATNIISDNLPQVCKEVAAIWDHEHEHSPMMQSVVDELVKGGFKLDNAVAAADTILMQCAIRCISKTYK